MGDTGLDCYNEGVACEEAGDVAGAFEAYRRSAKIAPTIAAPYVGLARLLTRNHQRADAVACLERALAFEPRNVAVRTILGRTLAEDGRLQEARVAFETALLEAPEAPAPLLGLGALYEDLGDRGAAAKAYSRLLSAHPDHAEGLAGLLAVAEGDALIDILRDAGDQLRNASDRDAALIGYALGKALDRSGNPDGAFSAWSAANFARRRSAGPFDLDAFNRRVDQLINIFTPQFFAERQGWGDPSDRPVFIVGLPRSGTTLTEQVLAGQEGVHGAGELDLLTDMATGAPDRLGREDLAWPGAAIELTREHVTSIAHDHLHRLAQLAPGDSLRIIDKQPLNFWHLGLVAMTLPNARIVNCRRDIRDCGLSIFSENFTPEQPWATDLEDIAHYWRGYRRLMDHWREVTSLCVLDMNYEDMVDDLEGQSRRLLGFLNLPWDSSVLRFHETERAIQTPSRWQVRRPLYRSSSGRWRIYAERLGSLIAAAREI